MSNDEFRNHSSTESRRDAREFLRRGPAPDEEELATKMLHVQSKRIYLDVKQNRRGRFIKIAEVGASGRKSRLVMSIAVANMFHKCLEEFNEFCSTLSAPTGQNVPNNGFLKSKVMRRKNRRYYVDLKENDRGRFLRVTQTTMDSDGPRSHIALPAQGIVEFKNALRDLLNEYGNDENNSISPSRLPEGTQIRSERKMIYFDIGQNDRGIFMRITEVKGAQRNSITIPESSWRKVCDFMVETCGKMESLKVDDKKPSDVQNVVGNVNADQKGSTAGGSSAHPSSNVSLSEIGHKQTGRDVLAYATPEE